MSKTRIPTQKRSIEKRNKIIEKGFELMCKNGYHNTNTSDIAKYTGVSTGIIYQYFNDKKEIFIEGIKCYIDKIMFPTIDLIDENKKLPNNLEDFLKKIIKTNIEKHISFKKAHQELSSMKCLDDNIENIFKEKELILTNKLYNLFLNNNYKKENLKEKIHITVNLIDSLAHEEAYHKHPNYNYDKMEDIVIKMIINTLKDSA